jgi:hypothetical protein
MMIWTNNAFVYITEHESDPALLVVRGRFKGDVDRFLLAPIAIETPDEEYRYRAAAKREDVALALKRIINDINYRTLLSSIRTTRRFGVVAAVNRLMAAAEVEEPWHLPHMEQK